MCHSCVEKLILIAGKNCKLMLKTQFIAFKNCELIEMFNIQ